MLVAYNSKTDLRTADHIVILGGCIQPNMHIEMIGIDVSDKHYSNNARVILANSNIANFKYLDTRDTAKRVWAISGYCH